MNPEILRGLLIQEMGRARTDVFMERLHALSAVAEMKAELQEQSARVRLLEAEAAQRAEAPVGDAKPDTAERSTRSESTEPRPVAPHLPS